MSDRAAARPKTRPDRSVRSRWSRLAGATIGAALAVGICAVVVRAQPAAQDDDSGAAPAAQAPTQGAAPQAGAPAPGRAPEEAPRPLRPDELVVMDFQDVELPTLIKFISEITGKNFVVDDKVKGKVSIVSPSKITVDEAYRVFQSVLQVKGFSVVDTGPVVKIVPIKDIKGSGLPIGPEPGAPGEAYITRLIPLQHLEAAQAAQVLQPLVSRDGLISAYGPTNSLIVIDTAMNLSRLAQLIADLDVPGQERSIEVIPLHHAYAGDLAQILKDAIEDSGGRTRPPGGPPAGVPGTAPPSSGGSASRSDSGLRVVPDERSNAIIVIGSQPEIRQARALIAKLDTALPHGSGRVNVYALRYADATEMVQVLADLVGTSTPIQKRAVLPGRAVTEGGGRYGRQGMGGGGGGGYGSASGFGGGSFGRSVIGNASAGTLGQGAIRQAGYGGGGPGGIASAGAGPPAIEFESGVRITADQATNSLVISAAPQDYAILREVIEKLDIARRQVLVEAIIFEVSLTRAKQLGIELQGAVSAGNLVALGRTSFQNLNTLTNTIATGDTTTTTGLGALNGLLGALIGKQTVKLANGTEIPADVALLSALQNTTGVNVLSAPTILTTDNEEAEIVVGQNVPFVSNRATNETNLQNTFSQIDRRDVGITLRLTPQISEGDSVRLLLFEEVSALVPTSETQVLQLGPTTTVRSATTNVVVRDADTVAIGGLISDSLTNSDQGVPYLTDIPVIGNLFNFKDRRKEKVNLIILLTPHIVRDADAMRLVSDGEKARFREAMIGKGRFAGTQASLSAPPRPAPAIGGVLLPAEGDAGEPLPAAAP